ncbi:MAG TPA: hypothetical protein VGG29_09665 [Caulobacteraceae bacterium]|jgi:hypothetical protein
MRRLILASMLLGLATAGAAPAAWADGPVATASAAQASAPQPQAAAPPLPPQKAGAPQPGDLAQGPCGPERVKADGKLERAPHGEVEAGVGTHGYRHLAGEICQPIGQNGAVTVGVSESQIDWRRRR